MCGYASWTVKKVAPRLSRTRLHWKITKPFLCTCYRENSIDKAGNHWASRQDGIAECELLDHIKASKLYTLRLARDGSLLTEYILHDNIESCVITGLVEGSESVEDQAYAGLITSWHGLLLHRQWCSDITGMSINFIFAILNNYSRHSPILKSPLSYIL